jgi:hypothetical protein
MNKVMLIIIILAVLAIAASSGIAAYYLSGNQSVAMICKGDEFIIQQYSDTEILVTCRVWVLR